jgi:NCS1 family nucleobase:cation symporter-1
MAEQQGIGREVEFGFLPTLGRERAFSWIDFTLVQTGFGIAAWCFLVGGYTGSFIEGKYGIWVILLGNALPVLLILPYALSTARYGVDTFIASNPALGHNLSRVFFVIFAILNLGWITIACFMLGESCIKVAKVAGLPEFLTTRTIGAPIFSLIFYLLGMYVAWKGPVAIKRFARVGVPAIILILFGLIIAVVFKYGFTRVMDSEPATPFPTLWEGISNSVEVNAGLGFSWLVYLGQWCRLARSESAAIQGTYLGYGLLLNVAGIFGAFTALIVGSLDPTDWMIGVGGTVFGVFGLILLILANLTSTVVLMYSQALSVKTMVPKLDWKWAILTNAPAAFLMFSPAFYDAYTKFLAYVAFIMATFGGVLVADWFFVRRQRFEVGALYDHGNPQYRYWYGWNPAAIVAVAVGTGVYWLLYNPVTFVYTKPFALFGAAIPSFFAAAATYAFCALVVFRNLESYRLDRLWRRRVAQGEADAVVVSDGMLPGAEIPGVEPGAAVAPETAS